MNTVGEDQYFPMMGMGGGPGPAIPQDCDSGKIGLGLHAEEPFPTFVPGDFASLRVPEQNDDRRSFYAQSICTQPSLGQDAPQRPPSASDSGEDCLNFLAPIAPYTLLDEWSQPVDILLSAQLAGLFSRETQVLEGTMPDENSVAPESMNLICYRRNLISITGHVAIPAKLRLVENAQGQQVPIVSQEIVLSVFESLERGRGGRLIQSLRSGPPISAAAEADSDSPGPEPISLDPEKAEEGSQDQEYVIFPFEWQRLQFRKATPNNGKSRDRQKYFFVSIKILANLADGQKVSISEASSNPIVVRGRGPQNFVAKDTQKLGRSRSLNSTNEGRLKKPNRHATRNSLLRQSLSRKARADSTTTSSDALQRMSIDDLSALFQDTTSADVRPFTATHGPLNDLDADRSRRRGSPASATPPAPSFSYMHSLRSSSIPPRFGVNRSAFGMGADTIETDNMGFSPDGFSDTSPSAAYPNISSVSPQDLEKTNNQHFGHPLSPPRSDGFRSSSVDAERRYRSPFESAPTSIPRSESHTNVFKAGNGEGDFTMDQLPMSPPEDDFVKGRSVSVSAPNPSLLDTPTMDEKAHPFPITPMSPPKESELVRNTSNPPSAITVTDTDKADNTFNSADPLPSPRTQMEIFDRILTPFPPYQGVESWQAADIMTPIKEQAEPRSFPSITEPNEPHKILSFVEQLDSKPFITTSDPIEIISIPPPTEQMDTDILPSTETFVAN